MTKPHVNISIRSIFLVKKCNACFAFIQVLEWGQIPLHFLLSPFMGYHVVKPIKYVFFFKFKKKKIGRKKREDHFSQLVDY